MMSKNNIWTKEETIIAFNVYCKVPFRSSSKTNPMVIKYANIIGRSPSALNMKIGNFGRLDPELKKQGISGLVHGSKLEEEVWNEFNGDWDRLAYESEQLIAKFQNKPLSDKFQSEVFNFPVGLDREATVKLRVNQDFFRSTILASYNSRCCITGLSIPELLVASHISPWAKDKNNRTNPHNGLCINALHDKAFDKGLITITPDYKILVSDCFNRKEEPAIDYLFNEYNGRFINLPDRFLPSKEFLDYHLKHIFIK